MQSTIACSCTRSRSACSSSSTVSTVGGAPEEERERKGRWSEVRASARKAWTSHGEHWRREHLPGMCCSRKSVWSTSGASEVRVFCACRSSGIATRVIEL